MERDSSEGPAVTFQKQHAGCWFGLLSTRWKVSEARATLPTTNNYKLLSSAIFKSKHLKYIWKKKNIGVNVDVGILGFLLVKWILLERQQTLRPQPAVSQLWCLWLPSRRSTASRWQALVTVTRSSADLRPLARITSWLRTSSGVRNSALVADSVQSFSTIPQKKKKKMQPKKTKGLPISSGSCEPFRKKKKENLPPNNRVCEVVNRNKRTNNIKVQAWPLERRRAGVETRQWRRRGHLWAEKQRWKCLKGGPQTHPALVLLGRNGGKMSTAACVEPLCGTTNG